MINLCLGLAIMRKASPLQLPKWRLQYKKQKIRNLSAFTFQSNPNHSAMSFINRRGLTYISMLSLQVLQRKSKIAHSIPNKTDLFQFANTNKFSLRYWLKSINHKIVGLTYCRVCLSLHQWAKASDVPRASGPTNWALMGAICPSNVAPSW